MSRYASKETLEHDVGKNGCENFENMVFVDYFPIFLLGVASGFAFLLRQLKSLVADAYDFGNVIGNEIIVENGIHNISFPFPFLILTKSNTHSK
jgi:hypothetical protein